MERLSDTAIEIINELHTERLDYYSEYIPLIDAANRLAAYEDTGVEPEDLKRAFNETASLKLAAQVLRTTPDHLRDLLQAERAGRLVVHKASLGEQVWIIERDDCGDPYEISGYMFLASTGNAVIVTAYINSLEDLEETLGYHIQETAENYETDLAVFPEEDCYLTREEAEAALKGGDSPENRAD